MSEVFLYEDIAKFITCIEGSFLKVRLDKEKSIAYADYLFYATYGKDSKTLRSIMGKDSFIDLELVIRNRQGALVSLLGKFADNKAVQIKGYIPEDNTDYMYCVLIKDTGAIEQYKELEMEHDRYKVLMDTIDDAILEIDKDNRVEHCSKVYLSKFGFEILNENILDYVEKKAFIYKEDVEAFKEIYSMIMNEVTRCSTEIRVKNKKDKYIWCELTATAVRDSENVIQRVIIIIKNINRERIMRNNLLNRVGKDELTGLYNKKSGRDTITSLIRQGVDRGALLFIDIDKFKQINDIYGHMLGDKILKSVAECMREVFRGEDILCRFGGDEFCIFMSEAPIEVASKRAEHLQLLIKNIKLKDCEGLIVDVSIGIAEYIQEPDENIESLFENSDKALYQAKAQGKGTYRIYGRGD